MQSTKKGIIAIEDCDLQTVTVSDEKHDLELWARRKMGTKTGAWWRVGFELMPWRWANSTTRIGTQGE
jgi:hypothetical protein